VIHAVRDKVEGVEPIKERGRVVGHETVVRDEGEPDKRLFMLEPEFARVLRVMSRQGSTVSATLRQAYDSGDLRIMARNSPGRATGAHVSMIGHITRDELRRELSGARSSPASSAARNCATCSLGMNQAPGSTLRSGSWSRLVGSSASNGRPVGDPSSYGDALRRRSNDHHHRRRLAPAHPHPTSSAHRLLDLSGHRPE